MQMLWMDSCHVCCDTVQNTLGYIYCPTMTTHISTIGTILVCSTKPFVCLGCSLQHNEVAEALIYTVDKYRLYAHYCPEWKRTSVTNTDAGQRQPCHGTSLPSDCATPNRFVLAGSEKSKCINKRFDNRLNPLLSNTNAESIYSNPELLRVCTALVQWWT